MRISRFSTILLFIFAILMSGCDLLLGTYDEVSNERPVPNAGGDQTVVLGTTVYLDGSDSSDPENNTLTYLWEITSVATGSSLSIGSDDIASANVFFTSFTPDVAGFYTVRLTVNDGFDTAADDIVIEVVASTDNNAPTVEFDLANTDISGTAGDTLSFAVTTGDADGDILTVDWDFGDGTTLGDGGTTQNHTYLVAGDYTVTATVSDPDGAQAVASIDVTINALGVDPAPSVSFSSSVKEADLNDTNPVNVTFTNNSVVEDELGASDLLSFTWDFGNGATNTTDWASVSASYTGAGIYTVRLTVTDDDGLTAYKELTVTIKDSRVASKELYPPLLADASLTDYGETVNKDYVYVGMLEDGKNRVAGLARFDLRELAGATILKAVLVLEYGSSEGTVKRMDVQTYMIGAGYGWDESKAGNIDELVSSSKIWGDPLIITELGMKYSLDVSKVVDHWVNNPSENQGFALVPVEQSPYNSLLQFAARETAKPQISLYVEYQN